MAFAPDGETQLIKAGRSPRMVWGNRGAMAGISAVADGYEVKADAGESVSR